MDTNRLKRFATEARNILMQGVVHRLSALGFLPDGSVTEEPQQQGGGATFMGDTVTQDFYDKWQSLRRAVSERGINEIAEEAAYTWFNRLAAIRILVKNGLASPVLEYESEDVLVPLLVSEARQGRMPDIDADSLHKLTDLLDDDSKTSEQFALLIVAYCHSNPVINSCFGRISDYTELLLPTNILTEGGFVYLLNHTEFISEDDYRSPELIGWLYQFYISERKDEVFAKKGKFEADEIPAATQIFTPNWIVKYMVQNTVGRIYLDNNPYETQLQKKWQYLVGGAVSHCTTNSNSSSQGCGETPHLLYDELTDLRVADLACGSGHILNECFDLLYDLYIAEGYGRGKAIENIFRHNLTGVDLDTRAKQLATFALLLKACQKDAAFADGHCLPNVQTMPKCDRYTWRDYSGHFASWYQLSERFDGEELDKAFQLLEQAENLGSIMKFDISDDTRNYIKHCIQCYEDAPAHTEQFGSLIQGFRLILALTEKYHALVMNPPYMGSGNMNATLAKYVKDEYEEGKADLATVFVQMMAKRTLKNGSYAFIIPPSWMFLSTFEKLRKNIIENNSIQSLLHLSRGVFGADFGASSAVIQNTANKEARGTYFRLVERTFQEFEQSHLRMLFEQTLANHDFKYRFKDYTKDVTELPYSADGQKIYYSNVSQQDFEKIPGCPIGYWVSSVIIESFDKVNSISVYADARLGMNTGSNDLFLRDWPEVSFNNICFSCGSNEESKSIENMKWYPYNKGGGTRKWFGLREKVVDWWKGGVNIHEYNNIPMTCNGAPVRAKSVQFFEGASWSFVSSGTFSIRYSPKGSMFDGGGPSLFSDILLYIIGFLNSKIANDFLKITNPTMNYQVGNISSLPLRVSKQQELENIVSENISISKQDWDAHETSWDFEENPLLAIGGAVSHCTTNSNSANSCCGGTPQLLGGSVSHCTTNSDSANSCCGGTPQLLKFVNKKEYIHINGQQLPHWNQNDCVQFVTFRLADSLPQSKLSEYKQIKEEWLAAHPKPWNDATQEEYDRIIGTKIDKWLDAGYGSCILQDGRIRKIVEDSILHFNGEKYNIHAYVIMPNHVHVLLSPVGDNQVQSIVGSCKKFSAHEINRILNQTGSVWERESFDRMVRDNKDFEAKLNYIGANPQNLPSSSYTLCMDLCCGGTPQLLLEDMMNAYKQKWEHLFMQLHANEEELNRQFIDIYGLQDELTPDVPLDEITILQQGEISIEEGKIKWHDDVVMKQFISYAVGCMMGRYRLDKKGLHIAHPNPSAEEIAPYIYNNVEFEIDADGIIPLMLNDCDFPDNASNRFSDFVRIALGDEKHVENLNFVEKCLGKSVEQYFVKDFWKDHKKMYQNRPIYWLFSSKKGAFRCIAYMHRMNAYTAERIRTKYLLPHIEWLLQKQSEMEENAANLTTAERRKLDSIRKQIAECREYHDRLHVVADEQIAFDLDDGVVVNYAKFGDVLAKIK